MVTPDLSSFRLPVKPRRALTVAAGCLALLLAGCAGQPAEPAASASVVPGGDGTAAASPVSPSAAAGTPSATPFVEASATPTPVPVDCTVDKCVALTYDDGPSRLTNQLLDTFEAKDAVATFFLYGAFIDNDPATVLRTHKLGMQIGNHTTDHPMLTQQSADQVAYEISDTQERIHAITGEYPTALRPPYGDHNATVDAIAGQQGLSVVNWTDSPADWDPKDAATVAQLTLSRVRPGAIILMHDTKQWSVDAAPAIIDGLREQGYKLVTVDQIIGNPVPGQAYTDGQAPA